MKAIEENEKVGAGFHRDFAELIDLLPDPPLGVHEDFAPT